VSSMVAPPPPTTGPMALLGSGVPLTLLVDLALGPRSEELMDDERSAPPAEPRQRS